MSGRELSRRELLGVGAALALAGGARAGEADAKSAPACHFGFTKLVVADLEKSAAFYEKALALVRQRRIDFEGGAEILFEPTAGGGAMFVLIHYDAAQAATPQQAAGRELVLGFYADDLDALVARVVAAGGAVDRAPYAIPEMKLRVAFVHDPEGHVLELLERTA